MPYGGFPFGSVHTITNGKFSCAFGKGDEEPKKFYYEMNTDNPAGYINSASIVSNTLILKGQLYTSAGDKYKQLQIRTGEVVKPGVYKSKDGDVGFYYFIPDIYRQYVDDMQGDVTVIITSASNGIVKGYFSGTDDAGLPVANGNFSCRIKNYRNVTEPDDRWQFSETDDLNDYRLFGGNIASAKFTQSGGRYILIIKGNSD